MWICQSLNYPFWNQTMQICGFQGFTLSSALFLLVMQWPLFVVSLFIVVLVTNLLRKSVMSSGKRNKFNSIFSRWSLARVVCTKPRSWFFWFSRILEMICLKKATSEICLAFHDWPFVLTNVFFSNLFRWRVYICCEEDIRQIMLRWSRTQYQDNHLSTAYRSIAFCLLKPGVIFSFQPVPSLSTATNYSWPFSIISASKRYFYKGRFTQE